MAARNVSFCQALRESTSAEDLSWRLAQMCAEDPQTRPSVWLIIAQAVTT